MGTRYTEHGIKPTLSISTWRRTPPTQPEARMGTINDTIIEGLKTCDGLPAVISYLNNVINDLKRKPLIFYHANCVDGFASAYMAWKKFGAEAEYKPLHAGSEAIIGQFDGRDVYFLDVSPSLVQLEQIAQGAKSVTVIDHHASAIKNLAGANRNEKVDLILDKDHSGAVLAARYWGHRDVDDFAQLVEDYDMWKFQHTATRPFNAYMEIVPFTFEAYDSVAQRTQAQDNYRGWNEMVAVGEMLLAQKKAEVDRVLKDLGTPRRRPGETTIVSINSTKNRNEISEAVLATYPDVDIVRVWHVVGNDIRVSLRSRKGGIDVNEYAKAMAPNGGGHASAAGYTLKDAANNLNLPWSN